jgi:UPF0716 protein FxsA
MRPLLFVLFIVMPLVELAVIIQVGQLVGVAPTILALLAVSVAGAILVKREGLRAWSRFRDALGSARLPAEEVTDGALVLLAGALLLTPGFVTDGIGLLLLLPPSRAVVNRAIRTRVRWSLGVGGTAARSGAPGSGSTRASRDRSGGTGPDGDIEVEVVDVRRSDPDPSGPRDDPRDEPRDELGRG